jgi:hydrogenase maturation protease
MRILILGYGNPSRMDDGVGHFVVNRLNAAWGLPAVDVLGEPGEETARVGGHAVTTRWVQQLDMGLAEEVAAADQVLFVDAHVDPPDIVVAEVTSGQHHGVTSHVLTPETVVALAESCFGRRPPAWRCSVRGARWGFGVGLSPAVETHALALAEQIRRVTETGSGTVSCQTPPETVPDPVSHA